MTAKKRPPMMPLEQGVNAVLEMQAAFERLEARHVRTVNDLDEARRDRNRAVELCREFCRLTTVAEDPLIDRWEDYHGKVAALLREIDAREGGT